MSDGSSRPCFASRLRRTGVCISATPIRRCSTRATAADGRRAFLAAHRRHRPRALQARISSGDHRRSRLARPDFARGAAPPERAWRRLRRRARRARGARPRLSLFLHARRNRARQRRLCAIPTARRSIRGTCRASAGCGSRGAPGGRRARGVAPRHGARSGRASRAILTGANMARATRDARSGRARRSGATSCSSARIGRRAIIWPSSSTTRRRASATSCAAAISIPPTSVHRLLQELLGIAAAALSPSPPGARCRRRQNVEKRSVAAAGGIAPARASPPTKFAPRSALATAAAASHRGCDQLTFCCVGVALGAWASN